MHFLYSVYYELTASTCFEHYFLIFRRLCTNSTWYIACVLCLLAAYQDWSGTSILVAGNSFTILICEVAMKCTVLSM
jgi:hypothetical protein